MNPNFEKYIHQSLKNQEEFVDAEAIWEEVEPHVQPEKRRRRFFGWFFFGASIVVVAVGLWSHSKEDLSLLEQRSSVAEVQILLGEKQSGLVERKRVEMVDMDSDENKNSKKNTNKEAQGVTQDEQANPVNKMTGKSDALAPVRALKSNLKNTISNNKKILIITDSQRPKKQIEETSFIEYLQDGSYIPLSDEPQSSMVIAPFDQREEEGRDVNRLLSEALQILELSSLVGELSSVKEEALIPENVKLIVPVHKQPNWKFAIGLHAGIGKVKSEWTLIEEGGNAEYVASRKSTEKQLESSSIGLSFSAQMKNNISFRSGLEYHRLARRLNYQESLSTFDTIPDAILKLYVNEVTGDTTLDRGEFINTHIESYEKETYNYFHRLDIPLFVGYRFKKGRLLLGVEAGVFANVLLRKKGELVENTEGRSFYDLKKDEAQWYKTKVGVTPALQMNFGYEFAPGVEVYFSPYYRFKTKYSTSANLMMEAYSDFGIQLGLKYWLR